VKAIKAVTLYRKWSAIHVFHPLPSGTTSMTNSLNTLNILKLQIVLYILAWISFFVLPVAKSVCAQEVRGSGIGLLEAVRITLANQPNIHFKEKEIENKKGRLQSERGQFDTILEAAVGYNHEKTPSFSIENSQAVEEEETNAISYNVNLTKQFRTGVKVGPDITMTSIDTSTSQYDSTNNARVNFLVSLPLLKGRGRKATAANEMSAEKEYEISLLEFHHTASQYVLETISAYWGYLAANRKLEQLKKSESRARIFVREVKTLIKADERPAADLEQTLANLSDKTISRIASTQNLFEAKHKLGLAMGISFDEINSLPLPRDEFPVIDAEKIEEIHKVSERLIKQSLTLRRDYLAVKEQQKSAKIMLDAAINNLLPQVDLNFNLGYSGLDKGDNIPNVISSLNNNIPGLNFFVSINYQWPFKNNCASGLLMQRKAAYGQATILTHDLARNISSGVLVVISALRNSTLELIKSQEAVHSYETAVNNENMKFKLGMSTLLDLITMEHNLTHALLNEVSAYLKFSIALAKLRFETGTLVSIEQNRASVGIKELITIPSSW
jgi:outer membrane protein TolC